MYVRIEGEGTCTVRQQALGVDLVWFHLKPYMRMDERSALIDFHQLSFVWCRFCKCARNVFCLRVIHFVDEALHGLLNFYFFSFSEVSPWIPLVVLRYCLCFQLCRSFAARFFAAISFQVRKGQWKLLKLPNEVLLDDRRMKDMELW